MPLDGHGSLPVGPPLYEALEPAKLDDVETGLCDPVVLVEEEGYLAVALHPGHRLYDYAFQLFVLDN